jgi:hypothetical protein
LKNEESYFCTKTSRDQLSEEGFEAVSGTLSGAGPLPDVSVKPTAFPLSLVYGSDFAGIWLCLL